MYIYIYKTLYVYVEQDIRAQSLSKKQRRISIRLVTLGANWLCKWVPCARWASSNRLFYVHTAQAAPIWYMRWEYCCCCCCYIQLRDREIFRWYSRVVKVVAPEDFCSPVALKWTDLENVNNELRRARHNAKWAQWEELARVFVCLYASVNTPLRCDCVFQSKEIFEILKSSW